MKQSLTIGIVVSMQLLVSLLIQLLVIRVVGVGTETDTYIAAQALPSVIGAIVVTALQSVWLPRLSVLSKDLKAWRSEQAVAQGQAVILGGGLFLLIAFGASLLLPLLFPGFDPGHQKSLLNYSYLLLLAAAFNTQSALLTVALRARDRFLAAEIIALLGTLFSLIALYFVLPLWGVMGAALVTFVRSILVYIVQLGLASWPPISLVRALATRETWQLMRPLLFGTSIFKTSPLIDRYWASQVTSGAITILTFAQLMINSLSTILVRTLGLPLTANIARLVKESKYVEVRKIYLNYILQVGVITFGIIAVIILAKYFTVNIFAKVLGVDYDSSQLLWLLTLLFSGHLFAAAAGPVLVSVFYAFNDTKTPVVIGIAGFILGLFLKWIFFLSYGLIGIAIATSTYFIFNILLFLVLIESKFYKKNEDRLS